MSEARWKRSKWQVGDVWLGKDDDGKALHFKIVGISVLYGEIHGFVAMMLNKIGGYEYPAFWFDRYGYEQHCCGWELYRKSKARYSYRVWWSGGYEWYFGDNLIERCPAT